MPGFSNLYLFCSLVYLALLLFVCCCVRFSFFSATVKLLAGQNMLVMTDFCVKWERKPQLDVKFGTARRIIGCVETAHFLLY